MSLCYDFEKHMMITLSLIATVLIVCLIMLAGNAHSQNTTLLYNMTLSKIQLQQQQKSLEQLLNYCYQHADRPNPIQDLVDKGFLPFIFKGETCLSLNQKYNDVLTRIREVQLRIYELNENLTAITDKRSLGYTECLQNKSTTFEECQDILLGEIK